MNMKRLTLSVFWILLTLTSLPSLFAGENPFPRTVQLNQGTVTLYAPQVDQLDDTSIHFRAALAYRATAGAEPVFGAGWFESPVVIDSTRRVVHPSELKLTQSRFPDGTDDIQAELAMVLALQSPRWNLELPLDEIDTALRTAALEKQDLNTKPPKVFYRDHPALLITIDGEPVLREIENSSLQAVVNTPYPLISDGRHYYLNAAKDVWYQAPDATGPYRFDAAPPAKIAAMVKPEDNAAAGEQPAEVVTASNAPEIVVSTEPAELIVTDGPAAFVPLVDDLLVLQNSDDDVFMDVKTQNFYIVLSGRWYRSGSLTGPWAYQASDKLPAAFANIPQDSEQADSRVYVAGTEEANEAVLDAQVPQTAAVQRGVVDIDVQYDGDPVYQAVDGTDLVYIRNTGSTVLVSDGLYYLVQDGVWYVSSTPNGPWQVSDYRPAQVDRILPTSPVYNAKYVYVYDSTPEVVYVGYTPGYIGSYVYGPTIFYGTGWYYRPWVSPYYYYPRFSTWGFNVSYNPWYGWGFGLSWSWGPFSVGYYPGGYWHYNHYWYRPYYGYWGPGRYRPHHHHRHDRYAYSNHHRDGRDRYDGRHDDWRYDNNRGRGENYRPRSKDGGYNLYRNDTQRAKVASTHDRQMRTKNVYADRAGNMKGVDRQVNADTGKTRLQKYRTGPVSTADLRSKAQDVRLEADNRNAYQTKSQPVARTKQTAAAGARQRTPIDASADYRQSVQVKTKAGQRQATQPVANANARQTKQTGTTDYRVDRKASASNTVTVRQPQQKTAAEKQRAQSDARTTYRQTARVKSQAGTRQVKLPPANANVRQTNQVTNRSATRTRVVKTAPTQAARQSASPRSPQPRSARAGSPQASAPVQKAPQQSARQGSNAQSKSKSSNSGSGRSKSSHSRKD